MKFSVLNSIAGSLETKTTVTRSGNYRSSLRELMEVPQVSFYYRILSDMRFNTTYMIETNILFIKVLRYYIQVRTSKGSTSLVNKKSPAIYMDVFGEKGDTGRRLLQKRSCMKNGGTVKSSKKLFEPGQVCYVFCFFYLFFW